MTAKTRRPAIADSHDIVVMGSGHNEWVAAAYLAKAGKRVLILERQEFASGGVVTREINTPGVFIIRTTRLPLGHWPTPDLGQYTGPRTDRFYLVRPFMHPGGGAYGAGRATAIMMLDELSTDFDRVESRR